MRFVRGREAPSSTSRTSRTSRQSAPRALTARREAERALLSAPATLEPARDLVERYRDLGLQEVRLVRFDAPAYPRARVWAAVETLQLTGSFKIRGAVLAIERRLAELRGEQVASGEPPVVIAASAGNHGIGVAYAARHLGVHAEIVVPRGAARTKVKKIQAAGAKVIEASGEGYDAAEAQAIALAEARGAPFLSPYDDLDVLIGNGGSLGFEIARSLGKVPELVHCPIGGGGLAAGLASALAFESGEGRRDIVVPVQSEASCAFARSLAADAAVTTLPPAETLADGLEGGISERAYERARVFIDRAAVCTEVEIEQAMRFAAHELGLVVEGSAAVALVPALVEDPPPDVGLADGADVVIVLTGRNVDAARVARVVSSS